MSVPGSGSVARRGWGMGARVLILVLVSIVLSVAVPAYLTYRAFSSYATTSAGVELERYSVSVVRYANELISGHMLSLEALATSPDIVALVQSANAENAASPAAELDQWIERTDKAWIDKDPSVKALEQSILANPVAEHMRQFKRVLPDEKEVFVTDAKGLSIAETDRTSDLKQSDEGWWDACWAGGAGAVFVDEVEYDDSQDIWAMNIAVPVRDGEKAIGVLRGTVDVSVLVTALDAIKIGEKGYVGLVNGGGTVIYAPDEKLRQQPAKQDVAALLKDGKTPWRAGIGDLSGIVSLVAFAKAEEGAIAGLGWTIVAQQPMREILDPAKRAAANSLKLSILLAIVLCAAALVASRRMTRPLRVTSEAARALGEGDTATARDLVAPFAGRRDEVGELSHAFVELTDCTSEIASAARAVAGGDLTVTVRPRGERDALSISVRDMVEQMRDLVQQVANSVHQLTDGVDQVDQAMEQVARSAMAQTTSVENATSAMDRLLGGVGDVAGGARDQARAVATCNRSSDAISGTAHDVLEVARDGAQAAHTAAEQARAAAGTVRRTVDGMADIRSGTNEAAERVREMGERSDEIGEIIGTIEAIAAQTNLLALNAAIEAARAGEHGRGFAVVADEVRKLAEGAGSAAQEIGSLVGTIRHTIRLAMDAMDRGNSEVERGMAQANETSSAIEQILAAVDGVAERVRGITAAAQGMETGARDLVGAMQAVSEIVERYEATTGAIEGEAGGISDLMSGIVAISEENSAAAQEVAATTDALRGMAGEVSNLVSRFRLQ